jgi:hypothetical protein
MKTLGTVNIGQLLKYYIQGALILKKLSLNCDVPFVVKSNFEYS